MNKAEFDKKCIAEMDVFLDGYNSPFIETTVNSKEFIVDEKDVEKRKLRKSEGRISRGFISGLAERLLHRAWKELIAERIEARNECKKAIAESFACLLCDWNSKFGISPPWARFSTLTLERERRCFFACGVQHLFHQG